MRIYATCKELMSEQGRNLWEMGIEVRPKHYQNKEIEGNDDFITKECMGEQYMLLGMPDPDFLFIYTKSREWAASELRERLSGKTINPGNAYKLRRELWEQFLDSDGKFDYTYPERINCGSQYQETVMKNIDIVIQLLKDDPDTRKAILPIFDAFTDMNYLDGSKRIPCSMYYDFLIRQNASGDRQLNILYHQRSSDFIDHFGNDVWLAWKTMEYVAERVGVKPGYLIHTIDSLHAYKKDWLKLKTSLE